MNLSSRSTVFWTVSVSIILAAQSSIAFAPPRPTLATRTARPSSLAQKTSFPLQFSFFSDDKETTTNDSSQFWLDWFPDQTEETSQNLPRLVGRDGEDRTELNSEGLALPLLGLVGAGLVAAIATTLGADSLSLPALPDVQALMEDPTATLNQVVNSVQGMGPLGLVCFGVAYTVAEILAIPAIPLTASAGYLFGVTQGTAVVLLSASIAAAVSFAIGRTLLRSWVEEKILTDFPQFQKIDRAIGKEGFKLMLLLRLSPIFPFALSNYLYGASSVKFWPYFWGTLLGFAPGTLAYVYTGYVGNALTLGGDVQPWYVYLGGLGVLVGILKCVADVATSILEEEEVEA